VTEVAGEEGRAAAIAARGGIEDALLSLTDIPLAFDRQGVRDRLLRAIQYLYAVLDSPVIALVHHEGLVESARAVAESRALLARAGTPAEASTLAQAIEHLAIAEAVLRSGAEIVARVQLERRLELVAGTPGDELPARPFRASIGVPSLHALERRSLVPHVVVDPKKPLPEAPNPPCTLPPPATFEALAALAEEAASGALQRRLMGDEAVVPEVADDLLPLAYATAVEEGETLRRIGRDFLENIANFRNLRRPNALEGWLDQGPFEQRILDNLDAFASLGETVLPLVSLFHAEAKAPDPERAFAAALTLGCVEGSDTIGAAIMILKQSALEEHPGWIEGFWLASSPAIDRAMAHLCGGRRDDLAALALDVLALRGSIPDDVVRSLLGRNVPAIQRRVARALAASLPREEAIEVLLAMASREAPVEVFTGTLESLLRRGHEGAVTLVRRAADGHLGRERVRPALEILGLVGGASDLDRLLDAARADPWPDLVRRLGRFGHAQALPRLVELLACEDPEIVAAASEALDRVTGAGLRETVEEPWEIDLPPDIAGADTTTIPTRKVERVVADPARWSAWLDQHAQRFDPAVKHRAGAPFTPLRIVEELEAAATPPARRQDAALELALITGLASPFSPDDWVIRQKEHLADLRARVADVSLSRGAWGLASLEVGSTARATGPVELRIPAAVPDASPTTHQRDPAELPSFLLDVPPVPEASAPPELTAFPTYDHTVTLTLPHAPSPARAPLPFAHAAPAGLTDPEVTQVVTVSAFRAPLPFVARDEAPSAPAAAPVPATVPGAALPPAAARLTLAQHALLMAQIAVAPETAVAVYQRFGIVGTEEQEALDRAWRERLQQNPSEQRQWQALYNGYHAYWLVQARSKGAPPRRP
jgi:hypothetical protein